MIKFTQADLIEQDRKLMKQEMLWAISLLGATGLIVAGVLWSVPL